MTVIGDLQLGAEMHFSFSVAALLSVLLLAWFVSWLRRILSFSRAEQQKAQWLYDTSEVLERRED